jgi:mono/diheme cytochrome c family protein
VSPDGAAIYGARCAACHGRNGRGGAGPALVGPTATTFPDAAAEVALVARGTGTMPGFGSQLSEEELAAVVAYVRSGLG